MNPRVTFFRLRRQRAAHLTHAPLAHTRAYISLLTPIKTHTSIHIHSLTYTASCSHAGKEIYSRADTIFIYFFVFSFLFVRKHVDALQSLTLWREILHDMFKLWYLAETDLLRYAQPSHAYRHVHTIACAHHSHTHTHTHTPSHMHMRHEYHTHTHAVKHKPLHHLYVHITHTRIFLRRHSRIITQRRAHSRA